MARPVVRDLRASLRERKLAIGVDRLDYSKGLPERFHGFERYLERHPDQRGSLTYLQIAPVSRGEVKEYQQLRGHLEQITELDNRFHEILYAACDSKMLEHLLIDYHQYVQRVRQKTLSTRDRATASNKEHRGIMEAIKAGDAALAEKLAHEHMLNAYENMVKNGLIDNEDGAADAPDHNDGAKPEEKGKKA